MPHIEIISASVRQGRKSHRVARFFQQYLSENTDKSANIQDLSALKFPVFDERLSFQKEVLPEVAAFAKAVQEADAVLIVTPEYNGGYPAALKNVIDLLYKEWYHKPIGIITVSDGDFGGSQVITSLVFTLWKMKAWVIAAQFPVPNVEVAFTENGEATDLKELLPRLSPFLKELDWALAKPV
jgi:NAD(P)H-dependent FMN reductase